MSVPSNVPVYWPPVQLLSTVKVSAKSVPTILSITSNVSAPTEASPTTVPVVDSVAVIEPVASS